MTSSRFRFCLLVSAVSACHAPAASDTDAPDTDVPDTDVPDTDVLDTDVPDTDVPDTDALDTDVPDTDGSEPVATGTTYYLAPTGSDANTCAQAQVATTPKATFASAWTCLAAGDELVVADGTYDQDASPPAGTAGDAANVIIVRADHDGGAVINEGLSLRNSSYLAFIGLKITGESNAIGVVSDGPGLVSHDVGFYRIGFHCTVTDSDDACFALSDGTHHVLVQDSWGWGGGRYIVLVYGGPGGNPPNTTCDHNTFRRLVLRQGPHVSSGGNPQAGLALYYASNNLVENVVVIDSVPASDTSNSAFYLTGHAAPPETSNNAFYGDLALNNLGVGWYLDHNGVGSNNTLRDSVIWGSHQGVAIYADGTCADNVLDHVTVAASAGDGLWNGCDSTAITSSIFHDNAGIGVRQGSGQGSIAVANWNLFSSNGGGDRSNIPAGPQDLTVDPALRHVTRIEPGSPCDGAGQAGTSCGGSLVYRYQDGVLGTAALWPWPNEARIQREMCADAGVTRGFCASTSLTTYVWTYLGNPVPSSF